MQELWKDIAGFEGLYQVSSCGRVKSLKRKGVSQDRIRKPTPFKGYMRLNLRRDGKYIPMKVHRLVCEAFHGKPPFEGAEVNHIDGDKSNNNDWNLEWNTHANNMNHALAAKLIAIGEKNSSKLTEFEVLEIRRLYTTGDYTMRDLSSLFKVNCSTIYNIVRYKKWAYLKEVVSV